MALRERIETLLARLSTALHPTWAEGWIRRQKPTETEYEVALSSALAILRELEKEEDWRAIPSLTVLLVHDNPRARLAGAEAIALLVPQIPVSALPGFEKTLRESTQQAYTWHRMRLDKLGSQVWPPAVWALLSTHPSGYVREEAVHRLARDQDSDFVLSFLLLRLNDWVSQVRDAATTAVRARLTDEWARSWLPVLGLLDQFRHRSRADHGWLHKEVANLLLSSASRHLLIEAGHSKDRGVSRWAIAAAMQLPEPDRLEFIALGLKSHDVVSRLRAARYVVSWQACPGRFEILDRMRTDRFMPVRREVLYAMLSEAPEKREVFLRSMLLDPHPSVRHAARFYLRESAREHSTVAFREFYLGALSDRSGSRFAAAVAGVGETGTSSDVQELLGLVSDRRPPVAAASVRAVAALDRDRLVSWFEGLLVDPRPRVAKEAARALFGCANSISVDRVRAMLHDGPYPHTRRFALRVLLRRHPNEAVVDAIAGAISDDAATAQLAVRYLLMDLPCGHRYAPDEKALSLARVALEAAEHRLEPRVHRIVLSFLGPQRDRR